MALPEPACAEFPGHKVSNSLCLSSFKGGERTAHGPHKEGKTVWSGLAEAIASGTRNSVIPQQANFQADDLVWPTNDVMNIQVAPGRKKVPYSCGTE